MHLNTETTATLSLIPEGVAGIRATLDRMTALVRDGKKMMQVRQKAAGLVQQCAQKSWACEVQSIFEYVRDQVRYVQDPSNVELIQTPVKTLEFMYGDCDDKSILLAALLESIGHPTRFIAVGFEPGIYSHVYVETKIGNTWYPLETTEPVQMGWSPDAKLMQVPPMYSHN